jgi:hypothetical protein
VVEVEEVGVVESAPVLGVDQGEALTAGEARGESKR